MKFNRAMALHGDLAFSKLSKKAQSFCFCTDEIRLYKANNKFYVRGTIEFDALSFEELNKLFEDMYDALDEEI